VSAAVEPHTPPLTARPLEAWLGLWAETAGGTAHLINLSENHTFRVDLPDGGRFVLRVHRPGYQSAASIGSELAWLAALRAETSLPVPRPLAGRDGLPLQRLRLPGEAERHAVLFAFEPGAEPRPEDDLGALFATLGGLAAAAHRHVEDFTPPPGFTRPVWDADAILDRDGLWGDWRQGPGVAGGVEAMLGSLEARLRADLAAYGQGRDRFGLIHADMRLANLLVAGDKVTLIDFDDCGFGWFMYDFAASISFYEAASEAPELKRRWIAGYRAVRPLSAVDVAAIDTLVLLRRMALLAWIGSHHETELAQTHAPGFAAVTAQLAAPYLDRARS
jgi:Ser/Thr protein kinase RdoA (MazF antagonist)